MFDLVGVGILVALVALFGFLAVRAWRLKNGLLRWGGLIVSGLLAVLSAAVLALALVGFYRLNQRHTNPVAEVRVAGTAAQVARGQQLANVCASCHAENRQPPLSGVDMGKKFGLPPIGALYAPNLTPAGNIQDWSDGELIRAIREGVHKNGRSLLVMPAQVFRHMSDEDVQAVVAYLRAQPATGAPMPDSHFNVLGALFILISDFQTAQPPAGSVPMPQPGTAEYGRYVVDVIGCRECHGDQLQGKVDNGQPGPPPGPNLTQIVPNWTEEQFMTFFNTGVRPDGSPVPTLTLADGTTEPMMPWNEVRAATTDDELKDLYDYLHSLPPVGGPAQ